MASRRHAWLLVGMLLLLLTGCGRLDPIPRPTANSPFAQPSASASPTLRSVRRPAPIRIGAVLSLTGVGAGLGTSQKNALQLAVDELNAPLPADSSLRMELRIEDDGSDRARGVAAVQKLMEVDRVVALFGPTLSSIASAADPLAEQAGVPVLAISNTAGGLTQIGSNIFRVSLPEADLIDACAQPANLPPLT